MTKQEMAFHLFLKRMPNEPLTDSNRKWVLSKAEESLELAEMFCKTVPDDSIQHMTVDAFLDIANGIPVPEDDL